jgi:hypothetical protein
MDDFDDETSALKSIEHSPSFPLLLNLPFIRAFSGVLKAVVTDCALASIKTVLAFRGHQTILAPHSHLLCAANGVRFFYWVCNSLNLHFGFAQVKLKGPMKQGPTTCSSKLNPIDAYVVMRRDPAVPSKTLLTEN